MTVPHTESTAELVQRLRSPNCPQHGYVDLDQFTVEYRRPRPFASAIELLFEQRIYDVDPLTEPQVVIDGGAWLGLSVMRFRQLFPSASILAFEPDPEIFAILRRNVERNGIDGVRLVNAALGAENGVLDFTASGADSGSLVADVRGEKIAVACERLSTHLTQPVSLVKLNIEGSEADVIDELGERLSLVDQLLIEYHGFAELPQSLHRILAALHNAGLTYIVSHFNETNRSCVPPLRLDHDYRYFLLIYARRLPVMRG